MLQISQFLKLYKAYHIWYVRIYTDPV